MTTTLPKTSLSFRDRMDTEHGLVDRQIFSDEEIYRIELERVFGRAWLFMCHDSQIPNTGDFFQTFMGEEKVIVVRNRQGSAEVLMNACRHRGAAVCRAHSGNTSKFMCAYHGWTYDLSGNLIGVPGKAELYDDTIDRKSWGLGKAAQVMSYRGFIFATLDPEAPPLETFLGGAGKAMIDKLADYGDLEVVPGVIRHRLKANWKIGMENDQDYYHVGITHASLFDAWQSSRAEVNQQYWIDNKGDIILGEYGHVMDTMPGHYHTSIFPHMSLLTDLLQVVIVRHPKGPQELEMLYFTFVDKNASPEERKAVIDRNIMRLGPSGMVEQDDGENFEFCTTGSASQLLRDRPFNYQMGLGGAKAKEDDGRGFPVFEGDRTSEVYARWRLRCWAEWMDAENWEDLVANHSLPAAQ